MQPHTLNELVAHVEELLAELGEGHGAEVEALRARVEQALTDTQRTLRGETVSTVARIRHFAGALDAYVNDYPRLAVATAVLLAGTLGYAAGLTARVRA